MLGRLLQEIRSLEARLQRCPEVVDRSVVGLLDLQRPIPLFDRGTSLHGTRRWRRRAETPQPLSPGGVLGGGRSAGAPSPGRRGEGISKSLMFKGNSTVSSPRDVRWHRACGSAGSGSPADSLAGTDIEAEGPGLGPVLRKEAAMFGRAFRRCSGPMGAALLTALLAGAPSVAGEKATEERIRPQYVKRDRVERPRTRHAPAEREVPADLRIDVVVQTPEPSTEPPVVEVQGSRRVRRESVPITTNIDEAAKRAARWTAEEKASSGGRRAYYRVGFHFGMEDALADPSLGAWDYRDGVRLGLRDPQTLALGQEIAAAAAADAVGPTAREQVAAQFRDLTREPLFRPRPVPPRFRPAPAPVAPPELYDVFAATSPLAVPGLGQRFERAFQSWGLDPWTIRGVRGHRHLYDGVWTDPDHAWEFWRQGRRRSGEYRRLTSSQDRLRFRAAFEREFLRALHGLYDAYLVRGFRQGLRDGWDYGALLSYEWSFRLGYNEGFEQGVASAAHAAFPTAYADMYTSAYERAFDEWSGSPRPEIVRVTVLDGNDDGVFEPGEELLVDYELANYGGVAGSFALELRGSGLTGGRETAVELPGRSALAAAAPLRVALRSDLAARRQTILELRLAGRQRAIPVRVSYPLEFRGSARMVRQDSLAGRATVEVRLANVSRRSVAASVELSRVDGYDLRDARDLESIAAGGETSALFELSGLHPLDLLSGDLRMSFAAQRDGVVLDVMEFRPPERVTDLGNRDLLLFMVALAQRDDPPRRDVELCRELLLRRLRTDWRAAARGKDNPYKQDLRQDGTTTALGDLVQTWRRERRRMRSPEVFDGLASEVEALAEVLPGAHPFLRRAMRKLARELG
jgi:hypothetical protein